MKSKWNFMHSSFVSTLLLFLAVGIMLLFHGVQSGALTIPLTKDQTTWIVFLFPWIDALLSWLIQGLVTGAWSAPNLSGLIATPASPPVRTQPPEPPVAGATAALLPSYMLIPSRPATLTPPPEPQYGAP